MLGKNSLRKFTTLFTLAAVWSVYSMVAFALPNDFGAEITVSGTVTVNGQPAVSNSTIASGSTIVTGAGSSATISLGKAGRIEVFENSNLTLNFSATSISGTLNQGKYHIANAAGVVTSLNTKDTAVIADAGQADNFVVEVECSHTHVDTTSGLVTMRDGANDRQVVAGTTAVAGNLDQPGCKPCLRPGSAPPVAIAGMSWLLLVAAGAAGIATILALRHNTVTLGGGVIVVSPSR